jgi:3-hydroxyacyl-[acyl-carrier-protein] dehydratase
LNRSRRVLLARGALAMPGRADHALPAMQFSIPSDHPSLPGHFPGRPVVPGVIVLERVLEAIEARHGPLGPLRLPQVKFVQPLLPGEIADVTITGDAPRWRFRVSRGETLLVRGEVALKDDAG